MQREENSLKELEVLQNFIPFTPSETSKGMGWKGMRALRYRRIPAGGEFSLPPVSLHAIALHLRPPEKFNLRIEGLELDRPLPTGSIHTVPAGSSLQVRWQGSWDLVAIHLEPSIVARVATESFELDSRQTLVPPLYSLNPPGLHSAITAVYAELRAGGGDGAQLLVESLATVLSVHLIRHVTGTPRLPVSADSLLPRRKLRSVTEYITENLEGNPTDLYDSYGGVVRSPAPHYKARSIISVNSVLDILPWLGFPFPSLGIPNLSSFSESTLCSIERP